MGGIEEAGGLEGWSEGGEVTKTCPKGKMFIYN